MKTTDYGAVNDYSEIFCQVVSQIVQSELKTIQYDKTIKCTVVDTSGMNYNYYKVSDGATEYVAYSRGEEYEYGDSVYVTIPNGDVNEQKFIVGKAYGDIEPDYLPLKNFLSAESASTNKKYGITANGSLSDIPILTDNGESNWSNDLNLLDCRDITHLVVSARFSTSLPTCRRGIFGIAATIEYLNNLGDRFTETVFLLNNDMYGNVYQLKNVTQKFMFSISDLNMVSIDKLQFSLYQQNDFFDFNGWPITSQDKRQQEIKNISIDNFTVEAGYNSQRVSPNSILIYAEKEGQRYSEGDLDLGKISWLFITEHDKKIYRRWSTTPPSIGRFYNYEILEYDPYFDPASKTTTLEKSEWRICTTDLTKENYKGKMDQSQSGIEIVLYEIIKGNKKIVDQQRVLFQKKKIREKKEDETA